MSPKRSKKNRDLPDNLYPDGPYFRYHHPVTKKRFSLGKDRQAAIRVAKQVNATCEGSDFQRLVHKVQGTTGCTFADLIKRYQAEFLPEREIKASTLSNINFKLEKYVRGHGHKDVQLMGVNDVLAILNPLTRSAYVKHRQLLNSLFDFAIATGYRELGSNPVTPTMKKTESKQRERLSIEQFNAMHEVADPWFTLALDAALITLQGRSELVRIKHDDLKDGVFRIIRRKTEVYEHAYLEITAGPSLIDLFARAKVAGKGSPFLVCRKRLKQRRDHLDGLEHYTELRPEALTREFARLRRHPDIRNLFPAEHPPSFHEIRSLGAYLYEKQGYSKKYVQALMGHSDQAMTEYYQSGHEIKWVVCEAGLNLKQAKGDENAEDQD